MKSHPLHQSVLYKISSPLVLANKLGLELFDLDAILGGFDNYRRFEVGKIKKRAIQEPKSILKNIHSKIARWLGGIETPEYLHSAVRGRSYLTNAASHCADKNLIKLDIRTFYQSTSTHSIFLFFEKTMKCRKDVSMMLAKLLTVDGHLATGSPVSPILSYYAYKNMFDEIAEFSRNLDLSFSVYVDDMCLSGQNATRKNLFKVRAIVARHGLKSHKCHFFPAGVPRIVTGATLTMNGLKLPHRRHLKIKEAFDDFEGLPEGAAREKALHSLRSRLYEASQFDPAWKERARSLQTEAARA